MKDNLEITNLEKKYADFTLKNINIKVPKGKIVGFIGQNGSGKTTTIKAILNLISYNQGSIKIFGKNNQKLTSLDKEQIGVLLDDSFFSPILNVKDINKLMKCFYHNWNEELYFDYLKKFKIPLNKTLKEFSGGMKRKIQVLCAICHEPKLLILDEPTNSLDPIFRYEILDIFTNFVRNKENSILITTHITSDLDLIADQLVFIDEGQIILDISKDTLDKDYGLIKDTQKNIDLIDPSYYFKKLKYKNKTLLLINNVSKFNNKYPNFTIIKPSLEEIMLLLVKGE